MIVSSTVDAFVDRDHVSTRYGRAGRLKVRGSGSNHEKYAFYWFALPFPLGVTVLEATLRLHLGKPWSGSQTLTAERITNAWKESKVNWNNRPSVATADAGTVNVASLGQGDEVAIDLTAMLAAVSAGAKWYGVRLKIDNDAGRELVSSDHPRADWHATLDVEWSEAPEAPVPLGPTGGRIISKTQPLLVWQFVDNAGSTVQASSQVQTSTTPDFTSPNFDSGKVANTVSQFDLAGTAFPALANGAVRYWRVKVWDGTDLESDWSEIQEFRRENKGTLAITNPDAAPANQVNETTPPIAWTFTGRTQEAFEAWLYRLEESGARTLLAHAAKTVSTALEWEVPAGILRTGDAYLARVAIFDDLDRQAMAGDPDYVDAEQGFAYERDGTPDPVTALTATPDGAKVVLEFERTTDPDYFAIRVDGREVLDRVEVGDVFVSGDTYSFDYWLATPRVEHEYEVEAVVDDLGTLAHSDSNATATAATNPIGIWLADPVDSLGVFVAGKEKASMVIGEVANVFDVLGSRAPVRITDSVQGYEGSFAGELTQWDGATALEHRDRFLELKGRLSTLRLIIGDLNLPVELGAVAVLPGRDADQSFDVSFDFAQVGEFDRAFPVMGA